MLDDTERQGDRKKKGKKRPVLLHSFSLLVFLITGFQASHSEVSGLFNL